MKHLLVAFAASLVAVPALADAPVVEGAVATRQGTDWSFSVTVRHPDTGWDHYADGWSVFTMDGAEVAHRKLLHPHETEQPFTRSLGGVTLPQGTAQVIIRAHDSVHGWGEDFVLDITN